ncbi:TonB-dependent receptor domain-containing protein [Psychromarinibacter sp. S121]|uniref:TonB-dependent receptor domain-containing protein n=1 Tax=Psychromarinibacter sp. S121 TaxID=3415127 RepID=UPI003C79804A
MTRSTLAGLLATTALIAAGTASAQNSEEDYAFLGTIRIEAADAQANLGNDEITSEEIEGRNPATIKDVFAGESSVTVSGGTPIAQKVFVNGIEESLLSVTIDGARQNKSAFHHTGNVLIDPFLLKAIEVSKGLAPADAGPGALAGAIAYETVDARDLLEAGDTFGGLFKVGAYDNGPGYRASLALFGQLGGFEYLLSATRQDGDSYEDGDGTVIGGTEADFDDYMLKLAYTTDSGHRFEFSASDTKDSGERMAQPGPGGIYFLRPDFALVPGRENVLVDGLSERRSYILTYTNEAPTGWFAPTVQLTYNEQEVDVSGVYGINTSFSGTFENEFTIANGTVTAGLDFYHDTAEGEGRGPGPFGSSGKEKVTNVGVFAQARQDLNEIFSVSYGARYDWNTFTGADGSEFEDGDFSLNAAVDVILSDRLTLNAGWATSFGGYELGEAALINFGTDWDYTGLKPSRATAARVGLRYASGPWTWSAALFQTDIEDIAAVLPTAGARGQTSDMTSQGYEAALRYGWDSGFASINYTFADVELDEETIGSTAYYIGRPIGHLFALEAGWAINDQWGIGGSAEIALDNDDAAIPLPGYEVLNLYATYTPPQIENLEIRFDVRNVFNETYSARSSDGIDVTTVTPLTEPGRTFGLTATVKF